METLFVSDLHLGPERPEKIALFKRFLQGRARQASALYILGDLFDQFWVGNDDVSEPNPAICRELKAFSEINEKLFIIRGNRDLMLDAGFHALSGCQLLPDEEVIEVTGEKVLLSHGDLYCTRDTGYQRYRRFMESTFTRSIFPRLPCALRIRLAHDLRPLIRKSSTRKAESIVDVDEASVQAAMRRHGVEHVVHGHTHRPGVHEFELDGKTATRTVLPDWYEGDGVLVWGKGQRRLMRVEAYLNSQ